MVVYGLQDSLLQHMLPGRDGHWEGDLGSVQSAPLQQGEPGPAHSQGCWYLYVHLSVCRGDRVQVYRQLSSVNIPVPHLSVLSTQVILTEIVEVCHRVWIVLRVSIFPGYILIVDVLRGYCVTVCRCDLSVQTQGM